MLDLGKHAVFIWMSYGAVAIVLSGLVTWLIMDGRRRSAQLAELESRGVRRRRHSEQD